MTRVYRDWSLKISRGLGFHFFELGDQAIGWFQTTTPNCFFSADRDHSSKQNSETWDTRT